ncbi:MAG: glycosyltransferase involved in cell wall biosynthesis [Moritella sp.]|jgi:glycosyltransferase involved in cell wall biosynthesis
MRILQQGYRWLLRIILIMYQGFMQLLTWLPRKKQDKKRPLKVLATGTFYSEHWLVTHLQPMANAKNCAQVIMVAATQVPDMNKVSGAYAPKWLQRTAGQVGARLLYFSWLAFTQRPDVLVGFHLLVNGLLVALLARIIGAKSVYISGGGKNEVYGGGFNTENRIFSRIGQADYDIEALLIQAVNEMDLVISMGSTAVDYFKSKGVNTNFSIVPGGYNNDLFRPDPLQDKIYDLILIGRLSDIKRVDRFLHAIKVAKQQLPYLNAVIVGDGPDKAALEALAEQLGIADDVHFSGWQNNVHRWLQQSKCFVLTSDSEGLSQALIQAMMTGLPAIVSDVGDLGDVLTNDKSGYLISTLDATAFAQAFMTLLPNTDKTTSFSNQAITDTRKYTVAQVEDEWFNTFNNFSMV